MPAASPSRTRFAPGFRLIEDGEIDVLSLDVFDTLLWRRVARPIDAFVLVGRRLKDAGALPPRVDPVTFGGMRQQAETRARARKSDAGLFPEVTLDEIYAQFSRAVLRCGPADALAAEVEVEADLLVPDVDVAALAVHAAKAGVTVVAVSDTYMPEPVLRRLLAKPGLDEVPFSALFVSNARDTGKAHDMFDVVVSELGVAPERILHVGDHPLADIAPAQARGIRTLHAGTCGEREEDVLEREGTLVDGPLAQAVVSDLLDPRHGDFGLTGLRRRALDDSTRAQVPPDLHGHYELGAAVLGPVFTAFAEWVIEEAEALGVGEVFGLMREGSYLAELVNGAAGYTGRSLRARELWMSRAVVTRACLFRADDAELREMLTRRRSPRVREFLDMASVPLTSVPDLGGVLEARLDRADFVDEVVGRVAGDERLREEARAGSAELRRRLVAYMEREVGRRGGPVLLVDLGWAATIQSGLQRVRANGDTNLDFHGRYLATNAQLVDRMLDGVDADGFLSRAGGPHEETLTLVRSGEVLEQLALSAHGTLRDFDADARPVLDDAVADPETIRQRDAVRAGVRAFGRVRASHLDLGVEPWSLTEARPQLRRILYRFIADPRPDEAALFASWRHDDNFGTDDSAPLFNLDVVRDLPYLAATQYQEIVQGRTFWPAGLSALHCPGLAQANAAVTNGHVSSLAFESSIPENVAGLFAAGPGEIWDLDVSQHRPNLVNQRGLTFTRLTVEHDDVERIRIDPVNRPAVLRIDHVTVRLSTATSAEPVVARYSSAADLRRWHLEGAEWLPMGVVHAPGGDPQLILDVRTITEERIHRVDVDIAFAVLEAGPPLPRSVPRRAYDKAKRVGRSAARRLVARLRS